MISVCLPYWKRQEALDRMFEHYDQHYSGLLDLEFSVCDDGSPVAAVVPEGVVLTRLPMKLLALNPCVPINAAIAASSGDVVVLTNPEVEHRTPILVEMLELLRGPDDYVIGACMDVRRGGVWVAGPGTNYESRLPVPPGAHFHFLTMFHRELWDRVGGFDEDYRKGQACDDNDWVWRLFAAGARFRCTTRQVAWHYPSNLKWRIRHNRELFFRKWPKARRVALVQARESAVSAGEGL